MDVPVITATADAARRADLRRMKAVAAGLLLFAAGVYVVARGWERSGGAPAVAGYVRAAAEAGLVGGLADWFAVTALFRRPLGLPIPHTAIVPTRKDQLGQALGAFVGVHFLSEEVVRRRLATALVARRGGAWLARPDNAERVVAEAATGVRAGFALLRDDDVRPVVDQFLARQLAELHLGPPLGRLLAGVVEEQGHTGLVDVVARSVHDWLRANESTVVTVVIDQAPAWSPRFVDEQIARRVHRELVRVAGEVAGEPGHEVRRVLDRYLVRLADDLRREGEMSERLDRFVVSLGERSEVRAALDDLLASVRRTVLQLVDDPTSELRVRSRELLMSWGSRLATDNRAAAKVDAWLAQVAVHVIDNYRDEITRLITDTIDRWDAEETSQRIELQVGRDLQFIRLNGTLVGALVGITLHAASRLLA